MPWYKGNFHCHSTNSDGSVPPLDVARYYKAIGMDFVTVSDHNQLTPVSQYRRALSRECIAIPCCEYTGARSCHVVAVDVEVAVAPATPNRPAAPDQSSWEPARILQDGIDRTKDAGGVAVLCHPCWNWAYDDAEILQLEGATHLEVFNASPDCNSYPVAGRSKAEDIWDRALSRGARLFGVATDDAHFYGSAPEARRLPNYLPSAGLGWVTVKTRELTREAVRAAFEQGHFFASSGVTISGYQVTKTGIQISVTPWSHEKVVVEFVGHGGALLERQEGPDVSYDFKGDEGYVRARLSDTTGCHAFTQPVFLDSIDREVKWTSLE